MNINACCSSFFIHEAVEGSIWHEYRHMNAVEYCMRLPFLSFTVTVRILGNAIRETFHIIYRITEIYEYKDSQFEEHVGVARRISCVLNFLSAIRRWKSTPEKLDEPESIFPRDIRWSNKIIGVVGKYLGGNLKRGSIPMPLYTHHKMRAS